MSKYVPPHLRGSGGGGNAPRRRTRPRGPTGRADCVFTYAFTRPLGRIHALVCSRRGGEEVLTVYYAQGRIIFSLPRGLPAWAELFHTEDPRHTAALHRSDSPYTHHAHIVRKEDHADSYDSTELVEWVLERYGGRRGDNAPHVAALRWLWAGAADGRAAAGATVDTRVNADASGLGLLADLRADLGRARALPAAKRDALIETAADRIRPASAEGIVAALVGAVGAEALRAWRGRRGGTLAHRVAERGTARALDLTGVGAAEASETRRTADGNTVAHLIARRAAAAADGQQPDPAAEGLLAWLAARKDGMNLDTRNNYGESVTDFLEPERALPEPGGGYYSYAPGPEGGEDALFAAEAAKRGLVRVSFAVHARLPPGSLALFVAYDRPARIGFVASKVKAGVVTPIMAQPIVNKVELHRMVDDLVPRVTPETHFFTARSDARALPGPGVWMWRPEGGGGGKDAGPLTTAAELRKFIRRLDGGRGGVLTRYLADPLLVAPRCADGGGGGGPEDAAQNVGPAAPRYKAHVRVYLLVRVDPGGAVAVGRFAGGVAIRARRPYDPAPATLGRPEVHDTHLDGDAALYVPYPGGLPGGAALDLRVTELLRRVFERAVARGAITRHPQATSGGAQVWGADILPDAAGRPWLLEINNSPRPPCDPAIFDRRRLVKGAWDWGYGPLVAGEPPRPPPGFVRLV
jgi:hypothetical protein